MRIVAIVVAAAVIGGCQASSSGSSPYDTAESLIGTRDIARARDLYIRAAATDPDPLQRDRALIRAASLDWYVFQDGASARKRLAAISKDSREFPHAWLERARLETELAHDYNAARAAARRAFESSKTAADRASALTRASAATLDEATRARLSGKCPADAAALNATVTDLRQAVELGGPLLEPALLLLNASLLTGDGDNMLQAWRWYYADRPSGVAAAETKMAALAPQWKPGNDAPPDVRRALVAALAQSRMYPQADLVLRDPCAKQTVSFDGETKDLVLYAATLRRLTALTAEHYRNVAAHSGDEKKFEPAVMQESKILWQSLSWPGQAPPFAPAAAMQELGRRFGSIASLGKTDDIPNLLLGHAVIDETRDVEQYGKKAKLRFVQLDGMVSSGYYAWLTHNSAGTGGWAGDDVIYQIRPMYADSPVVRWRRMSDPDLRAEAERKTEDETRRDVERVRTKPITYLPGLDRRLLEQAATNLRDALAASGLSGVALRDAFIGRLGQDKVDSSIMAHEGRHAIDKSVFKIRDSAELEFRAKLSEIALARSPRMMSSILDPVGGGSAHGKANERVLTGVVAWMRAHATEISGLDTRQPLLPQLDMLTDEQIRTAFRSLDPLAKAR